MRAWMALAFLFSSASKGAEETEELPELVVEADRDSVLPAHFAGSATVIDAEAIARSGARGFGENAASRVLILIDGRPVNRPDMASVSWLEVPLARLERVEILRGSQTARFGDNAVGGVINLITKQGGKAATVVEGAGGSDGYALARLSHSETIQGNAIAFDLEHNVTDGWRQNAYSELDSAAFRWSRDLARGTAAEFGVSWADEVAGFPGPLGKTRYLLNPRESI